jgi:predicted transcriptional regulator
MPTPANKDQISNADYQHPTKWLEEEIEDLKKKLLAEQNESRSWKYKFTTLKRRVERLTERLGELYDPQ